MLFLVDFGFFWPFLDAFRSSQEQKSSRKQKPRISKKNGQKEMQRGAELCRVMRRFLEGGPSDATGQRVQGVEDRSPGRSHGGGGGTSLNEACPKSHLTFAMHQFWVKCIC